MEGRLSNSAPPTTSYERLRRFSRHRFDARIKASVSRQGQSTTCWGLTSEIGQDGLGATLGGELEVGEVVCLEFSIPLRPYVMELRAAVRYRQGLRCGFEFLILTDQQKIALSELCANLDAAH